jgi:hypothetical protein
VAYTYLQLKGRVMDIPHRPKNQDETEIKALINESYFALVTELGCYTKTFTAVALTANDGDYDVITDWSLTDFAAMRSLNYTAASGLFLQRPLDPTTPDEILSLRQSNPVASSPSVTYAMPDWRTVMLQPLPATGDTVSGIYDAYPAAMSADVDTPTRLPPDMHHLIVGHCAAIAMEQMDITLANQMMTAFYAGELRRAKSSLNQRKGSRAFAPGAHRNVAIQRGEYWSGLS